MAVYADELRTYIHAQLDAQPELVHVIVIDVPATLAKDPLLDPAASIAELEAAVRHVITRPDVEVTMLEQIAGACVADLKSSRMAEFDIRARRGHWTGATPTPRSRAPRPPSSHTHPRHRRSRWARPLDDQDALRAYYAELAGLCLFIPLVFWLLVR
jgi:hypothetical protein